jgi:hypothetical protein
MKVLLISANTEQINMPVPPLGMAFVARAAEDANHDVYQINLKAEPEALASLAARIRRIQPQGLKSPSIESVKIRNKMSLIGTDGLGPICTKFHSLHRNRHPDGV